MSFLAKLRHLLYVQEVVSHFKKVTYYVKLPLVNTFWTDGILFKTSPVTQAKPSGGRLLAAAAAKSMEAQKKEAGVKPTYLLLKFLINMAGWGKCLMI